MTVHVMPVEDIVDHHESQECLCGPRIEWLDPDTGEPYEDGPVVIHNSLDGRELREEEGDDGQGE
jgi:hypothetical protein